MSVTVHEELAPRQKVRRRRSRIGLRQPDLAFAPAAMILLFAAGLIGMLAATAFLFGDASSSARNLALPALLSTMVTALTIGRRVRRYKERYQLGVALRTTCIWASFGAVCPLLQLVPAISYGEIANGSQLLQSLAAMSMDYVGGAVVGALGGIAGGGAALFLCVQRVS